MAYGLRKIHNKGYVPYGSGRDWFFLGDHEYQNGRRTPMPQDQERVQKILEGSAPPPQCPKGIPAEVNMSRKSQSMRYGKEGAAKETVELWKKRHGEPPPVCPDNVERWRHTKAAPRKLKSGAEIQRSATTGALGVTSPKPPVNVYQATSWATGSCQDFDYDKLGDKYGRFATPIMHTSRFGFMDKVVAEAAAENVPPTKGRSFDESMLGDKHARFSTPVSHFSRFEFLDGAVQAQPSPKVRLRYPDATKFDESRLGDKHNYYSTPISDKSRFGFMDTLGAS